MNRMKDLEKRKADHARKEIAEISIQIFPSIESKKSYKILVKNSGQSTFQNIRIRYEPILLWAGHFGQDTTHMPFHHQFSADEPLIIEQLSPNTVIEFSRNGGGIHERYDGLKNTEVFVTGPTEEVVGFPINNFNWCKATLELPNAKVFR